MLDFNNTETDKVLIAKKVAHKGAMFGHISNGGGIIKLNEQYSINFVAMNEKFITLQLFRHAINAEVQTQTWQKVKAVKAKPIQRKITEIKDVIETKVESEDLL